MNRFLIFSFLVFVSNNCISQDLFSIAKSMVKIQVNTATEVEIDSAGIVSDRYSKGSGFYISDKGLILTAAHVISKRNKSRSSSLTCYDNISNKAFSVNIIYENLDLDIAILENTEFTNFKNRNRRLKNFVNISKYSKIKPTKNKVLALGFPSGLNNDRHNLFSFSTGEILKFNTSIIGYGKIKSRKDVIVTTSVVHAGFSGGVLLDSNFIPLGLILGSIVDDKQNDRCYAKSFERIFRDLENKQILFLDDE